MLDFNRAPLQDKDIFVEPDKKDRPTDDGISEYIVNKIAGKSYGDSGEVRLNCPNCVGGQTGTLAVNAVTGVFICHRCNTNGNFLKKKHDGKKPKHQWIYEEKSDAYSGSDYLERAGVFADSSVKSNVYKGSKQIVIPYYKHHLLSAIQTITDDGQKKFHGEAKDSYHLIPGTPDSLAVYVCEGYKTGAAIHLATECPVVCVGTKSNFIGSFKNAQKEEGFQGLVIIFCADNDRSGDGFKYAAEAAKKFNARLSMPEISGTDFADLLLSGGVDAVKYQLETFHDLSSLKIAPENDGIEIVSLSDIITLNPQVEPIIRGLINKGDGVVIHAPGGLGKSMLSLNIALHAAGGHGKIFDRFEIQKPVTSLFLQTENSMAALNARTQKMMAGVSVLGRSALKKLIFPKINNDVLSHGKPFSNEENRNQIFEILEKAAEYCGQDIDLLWIDPLISFCAGDENDAAKMRAELDALNEICSISGVTPVIIHHDNKLGQYRGSTAIYDWSRTMLGLKGEEVPVKQIRGELFKNAGCTQCVRVKNEKNNNSKIFKPFLLWLDDNLTFKVVDETVPPSEQEQGEKIRQAIRDLGGTAKSQNKLAKTYSELSGVSKATAERHIQKAVENGLVKMDSIIVAGNQNYIYSIPD